jgi:hypothetical protein
MAKHFILFLILVSLAACSIEEDNSFTPQPIFRPTNSVSAPSSQEGSEFRPAISLPSVVVGPFESVGDVTESDLANQSFIFSDGRAFGLAGEEIGLLFGPEGAAMSFILTARLALASGLVFISRGCNFIIESSTFLTGIDPGIALFFDPCEVDADGRLRVKNIETGSISISE